MSPPPPPGRPGRPQFSHYEKTLEGILLVVPPEDVAGPTVDEPTDDYPPGGVTAEPYRPTVRPGMATLTVFDDGSGEGEIVRLRTDRFTIGREAGADLVIPHDPGISPVHASLVRKVNAGKTVWRLTDERSATGLFVRVSQARLADGKEFLVGGGRFRFEADGPGFAVRDVTPGGPGDRLPLTRADHWIGRDPGCDLARPDDPFAEVQHVRLSRDAAGVWTASHHKSLNGLWLRVPEVTVAGICHFQLGEQRFRLRLRG
jgi:pSer/pThr/pTyr-binding forkhead associated (FHA) protein